MTEKSGASKAVAHRAGASAAPKALVVWGGLADHRPKESAERVAALLAESGIIADITHDYAALADPALPDLALVVMVVTADRIEARYLEALESAVLSGVGLAGYHGGLAASFPGAAQTFHFMCGCKWVAHPGGIVDYRVEITEPRDPIVAGIASSFSYRSEQYYLLIDPAAEVLATTTFKGDETPWISGVRMPVVFKKRFGEGRIFYSSLGHDIREFDVPEMRTILLRGLAWAARAGYDAVS